MRLHPDDRGGVLAHAMIGSRDHGYLGNSGQLHQKLFDLCGADVLTASDDDVRHPIGNGYVSILVHDGYVTRSVPAVRLERLRGQGRIGVADEQLWASGEDLAGLSDVYPVAFGVREPNLVPGMAGPSVESRFSSGSE
jgi:hypothetical protein